MQKKKTFFALKQKFLPIFGRLCPKPVAANFPGQSFSV
jgi:hypothetical protein